jgi:hypothetical protein
MTDEGEEALPPWCKGRRRAEKERKRACRRPPTADLAAWWPDLMLPAAVWPGSGGGGRRGAVGDGDRCVGATEGGDRSVGV